MAITHLNNGNFEEEALRAETPVLIDFWAPWCGPCKMLGPVLEQVDKEIYESGLGKICKVNVDEEPALAEKYGVMSIPTLVMLKNGKVADTSVGLRQKEAIIEMFKKQA